LYEDLNREFSKQLFDIWESWTVWAVASSPKVHGIIGPVLSDGSKPDPNVSTGFPVSAIFVTP
jgi:hypothetical protein